LVWVIVILSTAGRVISAGSRRLLQVAPLKGMITIAMVFKMMKAFHGPGHRWYVALGHPPHHKARAVLVQSNISKPMLNSASCMNAMARLAATDQETWHATIVHHV